jgi:hypothetical protein
VEVAEIKARNLKDKHGCRPQFLTSLIITSTIPILLPAEQVLTQATNVLQPRNFMGAMHVDAYRIYSFLRKNGSHLSKGKEIVPNYQIIKGCSPARTVLLLLPPLAAAEAPWPPPPPLRH